MNSFQEGYVKYFKQGSITKTNDEILEDDEYVGFYDEIDIKDFEFNLEDKTFYYPCPCGDRFEISLEDLGNGEIIARCPFCSLIVCVIYENEDLETY